MKNVAATRGRPDYKLTLAGAIISIVAFLVTTFAGLVVPQPWMIYPGFLAWLGCLLLLASIDVLRWKRIKHIYGGSFSRSLELYLGKEHYLASYALFILGALPLWLSLVWEPFRASPSWVHLVGVGIWTAVVMNLAKTERKASQKASRQMTTLIKGKIPSGRSDLGAATALVDFINSFVLRAEWVGRSLAKDTLLDYFGSNPILFQNCQLREDGTMEVDCLLRNLDMIPEGNRMLTLHVLFSMLADRLNKLYGSLISPEWARKTVEDCYYAVKGKYSDGAVGSALLRILPKGILEDQKLSLLSKEELESRVRLRTRELEDSKAQLQVLKEFHEEIVKRAPIGILRMDKEGRTIFANPRAADIFGLALRDDAKIGQLNATEIVRVGEVVKAAGLNIESLGDPRRGGDSVRGAELGRDVTFTSGTGRRVQSRATAVSLLDRDGNFDGLLVLIEDITERELAAEERREWERKTQMTSRLATVGEMASGIAHEINNPLTGVIGFAQLLKKESMPPEQAKYVSIINDGAERVAAIVKRLLAFARQQKPERRLVDINEILETTLQLRSYELRTNNIEVATQFDPDLPRTMADAGQLQQVFLNLMINAEKEMKLAHGKGSLLIKTEIVDGRIAISFNDDGPGIARENLEKIFTPFFSTRKVGEGTGLGLSVCWGIIAEHKGKICVLSEPGHGATFIVELPIVAEPEAQKPPEPVSPVVETPMTLVKGKILIVDDDIEVRQLLLKVLISDGHLVSTVDNASDALEMVRGQKYDLLLLDIKLPGMSGIELYQRIHEIAGAAPPRTIFITGDAMSLDTREFLSQTKATYVTKPFDVADLRKQISAALERPT